MVNNTNKILIIRLSSLGDVILTTPVIRAIGKEYPEAEIHFVVNKEYSDVVNNNPNLTQVYGYNKKSPEEIVNQLAGNNYKFVVDLQNNRRSKNIIKQISVQEVYSYKKPQLAKFLLVFFKINKLKHIVKITERYAAALPGLKLDTKGPEIFIPKDVTCNIPESKNKYVGIAPGSKHFTKMWPLEYYKKLTKLLQEGGYTPVLFGGTSDMEICEEITNATEGIINKCNNNKLHNTISCMKSCKFIVCNDSGMMHTATAANVPVVAIFGSTVKELGFQPYNSTHIIIENNKLTCRPCSHIGKSKCPKKHFKCMNDLTPDYVFDKIKLFADKL